MTSQSGSPQWTYSYEPFGSARTTTRDDPAAPENPIRFAGEPYDSDTGLYHLRARQYDPQNGRFLSKDPLPPSVSDPYVSTYVYANDRPTALVDPSGMGAVWADHGNDGSLLSRAWGGIKNCVGSLRCVAENGLMAFGPGKFFKAPKAIRGLWGFLKARRGANGGRGAAKVTFGHGGRHLAGTTLTEGKVNSVIGAQIQKSLSQASASGSFWGRVTVEGQTIEYRAYTLPDGTVNVGTYYVVP